MPMVSQGIRDEAARLHEQINYYYDDLKIPPNDYGVSSTTLEALTALAEEISRLDPTLLIRCNFQEQRVRYTPDLGRYDQPHITDRPFEVGDKTSKKIVHLRGMIQLA